MVHRRFPRPIGVALVLSTLLALPAAAQTSDRPWHVGVQAGIADIDERGFDEASLLQIHGGWDLWRHGWGILTAELQFGTTIDDGKLDLPGIDADWDLTTVGLAATYRMTGGDFYPLGRLGLQYGDLSVGRLSESDTGLLAGIGAGYAFGRGLAVELSWTRQFDFEDTEIDVIGIGLRY